MTFNYACVLLMSILTGSLAVAILVIAVLVFIRGCRRCSKEDVYGSGCLLVGSVIIAILSTVLFLGLRRHNPKTPQEIVVSRS